MSTPNWIEELPVAVTVTGVDGTILAMNAASRQVFAADGGAALVGTSVFACHPEPARTKVRDLFESRSPNHYTIAKHGQKKIIHQLPWYANGEFAGFVELSIPLPDTLPHFERQ